MKKMIALIGLMMMVGNFSFATETCGDASVLTDEAVEYGTEALQASILSANLHGDVKTHLEPTTRIVKFKSQQAINFIECLIDLGKVKLNLDVEAFITKANELERLEKQTTQHGGRLAPTQEEIKVVNGALAAMKINRLARAYIANVAVITTNK